MTKIKYILLFLTLVLVLITQAAFAQVAWLTPSNPPVNEIVTLTYNSNTGNKALADYNKAVSLTGDEAEYYFARAFAYQDLRQQTKMCIDLKSACNLGGI